MILYFITTGANIFKLLLISTVQLCSPSAVDALCNNTLYKLTLACHTETLSTAAAYIYQLTLTWSQIYSLKKSPLTPFCISSDESYFHIPSTLHLAVIYINLGNQKVTFYLLT